MDFVSIGDVIMFNPDEEGRAKDRESGYTLGVNIGEVLDVSGENLRVGWLWSGDDSWDGSRWVEWRDRLTRKRYIDTVTP